MDLLMIEPDSTLGELFQQRFQAAGHDCVLASDAKRGLAIAQSQRLDAVVVNRSAIDHDPSGFIRALHECGTRRRAVLFIAIGAADVRAAILRAGADDCLADPFAFEELMARIDAVCRRTSWSSSMLIADGRVRLDLSKRRVACDGRETHLSPIEIAILELLVQTPGQVVTYKSLIERVWKSETDRAAELVGMHISRLRSKLGSIGAGIRIQFIRGKGYVFRLASGDEEPRTSKLRANLHAD